MLREVSLRLRIVLSLVGAVLTVTLLMLWRGFPWQLALMVGLGAAVLIYSSTGTFERLRDLYRER